VVPKYSVLPGFRRTVDGPEPRPTGCPAQNRFPPPTPSRRFSLGGAPSLTRASHRRRFDAEIAPHSSEVMTRKQVAALLGVNPHHIPRLVERGMPGHRSERQWRSLRSEVLTWVMRGKSSKERV
jgi:hypothetical protein